MKKIIQITVLELDNGMLRLDFGRTGSYENNCSALYSGIIDGMSTNQKASYFELFGLLASVVESIKIERPDLAQQIRSQVIDSLKHKK